MPAKRKRQDIEPVDQDALVTGVKRVLACMVNEPGLVDKISDYTGSLSRLDIIHHWDHQVVLPKRNRSFTAYLHRVITLTAEHPEDECMTACAVRAVERLLPPAVEEDDEPPVSLASWKREILYEHCFAFLIDTCAEHPNLRRGCFRTLAELFDLDDVAFGLVLWNRFITDGSLERLLPAARIHPTGLATLSQFLRLSRKMVHTLRALPADRHPDGALWNLQAMLEIMSARRDSLRDEVTAVKAELQTTKQEAQELLAEVHRRQERGSVTEDFKTHVIAQFQELTRRCERWDRLLGEWES